MERHFPYMRDEQPLLQMLHSKNKGLANAFVECSRNDIYVAKKLKKRVKSLGMYHVQQAVEKTAKAMFLLDKRKKYVLSDLLGHDFLVVLQKNQKIDDLITKESGDSLDTPLFYMAFMCVDSEFVEILDEQYKGNPQKYYQDEMKALSEHMNRKLSDIKTNNQYNMKVLRTATILLDLILKAKSKDKVAHLNIGTIRNLLSITDDFDKQHPPDDMVNRILSDFIGVLVLSFLTAPHEQSTRYPNPKGINPVDYDNEIDIVDCMGEIIKKLEKINKDIDTITSSTPPRTIAEYPRY